MNPSLANDPLDAAQRTSAPRALVPVLIAIAVGVSGVMLTRTSTPPDSELPAFPLLPSHVAVCAHPPALARELALEREQLAQLRWERASLDPATAPSAKSDMESAAACYRVAGVADGAARASDLAANYAAVLERERRHQLLRLKIAIGRGDNVTVLDSIGALRGLLHGAPDGPFLRWLASLERAVETRGADR